MTTTPDDALDMGTEHATAAYGRLRSATTGYFPGQGWVDITLAKDDALAAAQVLATLALVEEQRTATFASLFATESAAGNSSGAARLWNDFIAPRLGLL